MPETHNKMLKFTQNHESMKISFAIYADMESLLEKIYICDKETTKFFSSKINKHTSRGFSLFTHCLFDSN